MTWRKPDQPKKSHKWGPLKPSKTKWATSKPSKTPARSTRVSVTPSATSIPSEDSDCAKKASLNTENKPIIDYSLMTKTVTNIS